MAMPDFNSQLGYSRGIDVDLFAFLPTIATASNLVVGTNPPYNATDLFTLYPQFGGTPTKITGTVTQGSDTIPDASSVAGLLTGQYVTGAGIAAGATVLSVIGSVVKLSQPCTASGGPVQLTIYTALIVPAAVINAYIFLASSSIFQARWGEMWMFAMGLFIGHYLTLWAMGQASPNSNAAQLAASGLAIGIKTSKSAGDVSVGVTPVLIDGYGSWNLTLFGQELATWASVVGSGSALIW